MQSGRTWRRWNLSAVSTADLDRLWREYISSVPGGAVTGELNFLPFLVFLARCGWRFNRVSVADANEARESTRLRNLVFFRGLYAHFQELRNREVNRT